MPVELGLGDPQRLGEVLVGQRRVDDLGTVLGEVARIEAAFDEVIQTVAPDREAREDVLQALSQDVQTCGDVGGTLKASAGTSTLPCSCPA